MCFRALLFLLQGEESCNLSSLVGGLANSSYSFSLLTKHAVDLCIYLAAEAATNTTASSFLLHSPAIVYTEKEH